MSRDVAAEILQTGDSFKLKYRTIKAGKITRVNQPNGKDYIEVVTEAGNLYLRTNEIVKVL